MVTTLELHGYDEFQKYIANIDPNSRSVVVYFTGEKLPSGLSWCIDCVEGTDDTLIKYYLISQGTV